jgi:hypothetical protein
MTDANEIKKVLPDGVRQHFCWNLLWIRRCGGKWLNGRQSEAQTLGNEMDDQPPAGVIRHNRMYESMKPTNNTKTGTISMMSPILERIILSPVFRGSTLAVFVKVAGSSMGFLLQYSPEKQFL